MCINPKLKLNPKYLPNAKNGGNPPVLLDERVKYVPIGCGKCFECRRQKANNWKVRLFEEIKNEADQWAFVTLTFSDDSLNEIRDILINKYVDTETGELKDATIDIEKVTDDNAVATYAVRHFLERWRKLNKRSVKHWFVTEKGHNGTKRIHLHGLIKSRNFDMIEERWSYGWIYPSNKMNRHTNYVSEKSINYISKYVTKVDTVNKDFQGKILCSAGIGSKYVDTFAFELHKFRKEDTKDYYINYRGGKMNLPIYYRNKAYKEIEREILWIYKIEKGERFIFSEKFPFKTNEDIEIYFKALERYRVKNKELGYWTDPNWTRDIYEKRIYIINESFGKCHKLTPEEIEFLKQQIEYDSIFS